MKAFSYCVVSVVLVFLATVLFAHSQSVDLPNFHKVNDGLYRGGQPKDDGFAQLKKMGIKVEVLKDSLIIHGGKPVGAEIDTYGDHRTAMSFAVAGTKIPGIIIRNPLVVSKTFPDFWKKMEEIS